MKLALKVSPLILLFSLFMAVGCGENDPGLSPVEELSSEAKSFLGLRNGTAQSLTAHGSSAINKSFQGAYNNYASVSGSVAATENKDSTVVGDPIPWITCATTTETLNPDGSTTTVVDYGNGCEEGNDYYKYLMFGRYSYTYKYTQSQKGAIFKYSFLNKNAFENYGGHYYYEQDTSEWLSNGHSSYSGQSEYDSIKHTFAGSYDYSDTSEYVYNDLTYLYKSKGESTYDDKKSTAFSNDYEYSYGLDYYKSIVLRPLVMDYNCYANIDKGLMGAPESIMPFRATYVSGREKVQYKHDGVEGQFEIDYGAGECDNIIVIYENGKAFKIDLSTDYEAITNKG